MCFIINNNNNNNNNNNKIGQFSYMVDQFILGKPISQPNHLVWTNGRPVDTTKRLMSSPKCRSVEVINNPARPGSNHREVNCINYR